jgi:hypothetical protein
MRNRPLYDITHSAIIFVSNEAARIAIRENH